MWNNNKVALIESEQNSGLPGAGEELKENGEKLVEEYKLPIIIQRSSGDPVCSMVPTVNTMLHIQNM